MDKHRYPPEWSTISRAIRERAGQHCEWCGVPNGAYGARDRKGTWHEADSIHHLNSDAGEELFGAFPDMIRIVLTVAHLGVSQPDGTPGDKHDTFDCRPENLAALCQRCHLNYDRADHVAHAAVTRQRKKLATIAATGQLALEGFLNG
jgi:5-methylcytosine-specific restriction endonuclease McrA